MRIQLPDTMPITFHLKRQPTVPLEAEVLSPDKLAELSNDEIRSLIVYHGKRQLPLGEFFDVEGERSEDLVIHGALHKVRWIGRAMSKGSITIHGNVGMHLGAYMAGGRIEVHGHATRLDRRRNEERLHPHPRQRRRPGRCRLSRFALAA